MSTKQIVKIGFAALALLGSAIVVAEGKGEASGADLWLQSGKAGYTIEFVGDGNVAGLQFDVKGLKLAEGQYDCGVGLADTHIANCTVNAEGKLRVIVFSMENAPVPDGTLVQIRNASSATRADVLGAARQDAAPTLTGVMFADAQAVDVTPEHLQ